MDKEITMFDFEDFYSRIADEMPDDCRVCEVGVADGDSAIFLAKKLYSLGKKFKLYMVDNMDYGQYIQMKTIYESVISSGLGEFIEVIPKDSLLATKDFNDGYLDFVFIDSSHKYDDTKKEIPAWYDRVKDGGILAGHDYFEYRNDVGRAVDELLPTVFIREPLIGDDGEVQQEFEPEDFLQIEQTKNGCGVWFVRKEFWRTIKQ